MSKQIKALPLIDTVQKIDLIKKLQEQYLAYFTTHDFIRN